MPHGRKLVGELGALKPGGVYFRAHILMTTGDGTPALKWGSTNMYTEDAEGNAVYDFTIVDESFDTYLENGVRPYVQLGFMPEAMSTKPQEPSEAQYAELIENDGLQTLGEPGPVAVDGGAAALSFKLPRQGVSLLVLSLK